MNPDSHANTVTAHASPIASVRPKPPDFLLLDAGTAPARGLTDWLVDALRAAIDDGRLGPGSRLPASRALAADLVIEDDYDAEYRYDRAPVPCTPPRRTASPTPGAHRKASPRRCGWAGWSHRGAATTTSSPRNTPATWAARPCPDWCWPGCWKAASTTGMSGWSAPDTGRVATPYGTRSSQYAGCIGAGHRRRFAPACHAARREHRHAAVADELRGAGVLVHPLS